LYICWQQLNISADHLLIYGEKSELINTRIVHFHQLLERSRAYFFAMRPKAGEMVLRRQCERTSCLRHFAQIEEVRSSSLRRVQICGVWPRAVMRETAEMAGPAAEKKIGRWQCKPRDSHDKLPMC